MGRSDSRNSQDGEIQPPVKCYIVRGGQTCSPLNEKVGGVLRDERVFTLVEDAYTGSAADVRLGPGDWSLLVRPTKQNYGSWLLLKLLQPVPLLTGLGAVKLRVSCEVRRGVTSEVATWRLSGDRRWALLFTSTDAMMEQCYLKIAKQIAKRLTGRKILNTEAQWYAKASVGVGVLSLLLHMIPLVSALGITFGTLGLCTISRRSLPTGRKTAIAGLALSAGGILLLVARVVLLRR